MFKHVKTGCGKVIKVENKYVGRQCYGKKNFPTEEENFMICHLTVMRKVWRRF